MISREQVAAGGSGSTYLYGYLDKYYSRDMSIEECLEFVKTGEVLFRPSI
jgi:20S proteasome alpha/beta subunit